MKNPQLDGDDFYLEGNRTGILLIHGFTATTTEVRLLADKLHQAGFTCAAPLLPGHGTHPDDLNQATWEMWLEKVKQTYEILLRNSDRVYVIGESMGAVLALEIAAQHPEIQGLLLFAPAIKVNKLWLSPIISIFKSYIEKSGKDDGLPWKGYRLYPVKAAVELLKLQRHCRKILPCVDCPTMIFTGEKDQTISPHSAGIIMNGTQSNLKCHIHLEDSPHCIILDHELDLAFDYVMNFINHIAK
jgi:carboxylesterase